MGNFFSSENNNENNKPPIAMDESTLDINDFNIEEFKTGGFNYLQSGGKLLNQDTLDGLDFLKSHNLEDQIINKLKYKQQNGGHTFDKYDFFKALKEIEEEHGIQRGGEDNGSPIYTEDEDNDLDKIKNVLLKESKELSRLTRKQEGGKCNIHEQDGGNCKACTGDLHGGKRVKHYDSSSSFSSTESSTTDSSSSSVMAYYGGKHSESNSNSESEEKQSETQDDSITTEEGLHIYPFNTSDIKSPNNIPLNKRLLKRKI